MSQLVKSVLLQHVGELRIQWTRHAELAKTELDGHLPHGRDAVHGNIVDVLDSGPGAMGKRRCMFDEP